MTNFSQQPPKRAPDGTLLNPTTGETVHECAMRMWRQHEGRDAARQTATRIALSVMARRLNEAEFYAAVAAHLSDA